MVKISIVTQGFRFGTLFSDASLSKGLHSNDLNRSLAEQVTKKKKNTNVIAHEYGH